MTKKRIGRIGLISLIGVIIVFNSPAFAQVNCYDDGTFGPTCAATIAPTQAPSATLPPANTPPPELPRSGNFGAAAAALFGGAVLLVFGIKFAFIPRSS